MPHLLDLAAGSEGVGALQRIHAGMCVGVEACRQVQPWAAMVRLLIDEGLPAAALGRASLLSYTRMPCSGVTVQPLAATD